MSKTVAVIGASPNPERYAHRAMQKLRAEGHRVFPVNPAFEELLGARCYPTISEVPEAIDTVSMYVGAARSTPLIEEIVSASPRRIIFNPGAENEELAARANVAGIQVVHGCTLVMLQTGVF